MIAAAGDLKGNAALEAMRTAIWVWVERLVDYNVTDRFNGQGGLVRTTFKPRLNFSVKDDEVVAMPPRRQV